MPINPEEVLMSVIIGVDPHKASHTAVAIGGDEREVAKVTVRATCQQTSKLLAWAEPLRPLAVLPTRTALRRAGWGAESATA